MWHSGFFVGGGCDVVLSSKWGVWGTRIKGFKGLLALTSAECFQSCQGFTLLFGKVHSLGKGGYAKCTLCGYYWPCTAHGVQTVTRAHPVGDAHKPWLWLGGVRACACV